MSLPPFPLKQKPTDIWSTREKLALASSVERNRDQNWVSVSRLIRSFAEPNRPPDWFSQKNCALQYGSLLENVEKTKRKRGEDIATPGSIIVKNLTQQRITELEESVKDYKEKYLKLRKSLELLNAGELDENIDDLVDEMNEEAEEKHKQQEEHQKWLKNRELEAERQRQLRHQLLAVKAKKQSRTVSDASDSMHSDDSNLPMPSELSSGRPSSLITSLLRSPTQSPNQSPRTIHGISLPQSINAQRSSTESQHSGSATPVLMNPTQQSPTLTKLLESPQIPAVGSSSGPVEDKKPQIKSEVVEAKVIAEETLQKTLSAIEDVTKELQQQQDSIITLDPSLAKAVEAVPDVDVRDENIISVIEELQEDMDRKEQEAQQKQLLALQAEQSAAVTQEPVIVPPAIEEIKLEEFKEEIPPAVIPPITQTRQTAPKTPSRESSPAVIKSERIPSGTSSARQSTPRPASTTSKEAPEIKEKEPVKPNLQIIKPSVPTLTTENMSPPPLTPPARAVSSPKTVETTSSTKIPLQKTQPATRTKKVEEETKKEIKVEEPDDGSQNSTNPDETSAPDSQETESRAESAESTTDEREERNEIEIKEEIEDGMIEEEVSEEEIGNDDDRDVKTPELNLTIKDENVASSDDGKDSEKNHKIWKKSALLVWRTAANHSNANVFMNPVTDEMAPGYEDIVYKPLDLLTIKKNIENGVIKTTMELLRDMMLMFQNAIMYNSADHDVYQMAIKMQEDVVKQIEELMANEAAEKAGGTPAPAQESLKRPARHRQSEIGVDPPAKKPRRSTGSSLK